MLECVILYFRLIFFLTSDCNQILEFGYLICIHITYHIILFVFTLPTTLPYLYSLHLPHYLICPLHLPHFPHKRDHLCCKQIKFNNSKM